MRHTVLILLVAASPLVGQQQRSVRDDNVGVSAARSHWMTAHNFILRAAEQLPESLYAYKPTPAVRSFGDLLGHIASSEFMFCAMARRETRKEVDAIEKATKTKAAMVQSLKDAGAYCERAYAISDAVAAGTTNVFGQKQTKMFALMFNASHDWEHYGNIVTYMRLKGLTPPSSQR